MLRPGNTAVGRAVGAISTSGRRALHGLGSALRAVGAPARAAAAGRSASAQTNVLATIRRYDFSGRSDRELRAALDRLRPPAEKGGHPSPIRSETFAIVNEAITRRMGAWRLFDPNIDLGSLEPCRAAAGRLLDAAPYRSRMGYYTDEGFLDSPDFRRSLDASMDGLPLDSPQRAIVTAMVYVAEKSKLTYPSEILLSSDFYNALSAVDIDRGLRFQATDEQLLAGLLLFDGRIAEMSAGEGKTVAAAYPAVLHAVLGRPVHVITANDYLARRDADWLAPVYESLGLSVGAILSHMSDAERRAAYRCQIVYGTLREFGFDFLRDNLRYIGDEMVQGPFGVAIVDEADQVLIDESRTPLIIAGGSTGNSRSVHRVKRAVEALKAAQSQVITDLQLKLRQPPSRKRAYNALLATLYLADPESVHLVRLFARDERLRRRVQSEADASVTEELQDTLARDLYYVLDTRHQLVTLTERGQELLERRLGPIFDTSALERQIEVVESSDGLRLPERRQRSDRLRRELTRQHNQMNQVHQMLRACLLLKRDSDYIVSDGEIVLIDELTGRSRPDHRYQHGLQAAIEAKEGVRVRTEPDVLAQISVSGFVKQYSMVAGMTGTATSSRDEFKRAYGLEVSTVPLSQPCKRKNFATRLYLSRREKLAAVLDEIEFFHTVGRPVLVGTLTVDQSEEISRLLTQKRVRHRLLNAVNSSEEANVVKAAGAFEAVTVATNMAGRGTDIILEPDLDRRIVRRYADLIQKLLAGNARTVALSCASREESDIIWSSLKTVPGLRLVRNRTRDGVDILVTLGSGGEPGERTVRLEFGLGLHVIGVEMNDSMRVDFQLRGRGGRQGGFGSSRFVLSLEDAALAVRGGSRTGGPADRKTDAMGQTYWEGAGTRRRLTTLQSMVESDDEAARAAASEYDRAIERQTLAYYRARREVMESDSFHDTCVRYMRDRARRLVGGYFPLALLGYYEAQFDRMAEELCLDYGVDADGLWGLGVDALGAELGRLMGARLDQARADCGNDRFDKMEKLLFLQTCDELWVDHLRRLEDLMMGARLCDSGHRAATVDFMLQTVRESRRLMEAGIDAFLPRLLTYADGADMETESPEVSVVDDIEAILV